MVVCFWNINKGNIKSIGRYLSDLLCVHLVDLLALCEAENVERSELKELLKEKGFAVLDDYPDTANKFVIIKRVDLDFETVNGERRFMLARSRKAECTLAVVHLEGRNNQQSILLPHSKTLNRLLEAILSSDQRNEIIVGDFNCEPNAPELTFHEGMHAVLFKKEMDTLCEGAKKKHYNPVLLALNEEDEQYGSFRYPQESSSPYWYAYDQVLVSAGYVEKIQNVRFLKEINGKSLLKRKNPDKQISDHLPLMFEIKEAQ